MVYDVEEPGEGLVEGGEELTGDQGEGDALTIEEYHGEEEVEYAEEGAEPYVVEEGADLSGEVEEAPLEEEYYEEDVGVEADADAEGEGAFEGDGTGELMEGEEEEAETDLLEVDQEGDGGELMEAEEEELGAPTSEAMADASEVA